MEVPTDVRRIAFCENVARGMLIGKAYAATGYKPNPAQATNLAKRYAEYIESLRPQFAVVVPEAPEAPPPVDADDWRGQTGINLKWVAEKHVELIAAAMQIKDLKQAHASIEALRKMVLDAEEAEKREPKPESAKIDVTAVLSILDRVGDTIRAAKGTAETVPGDGAKLIDDSARWKVQRRADEHDQ